MTERTAAYSSRRKNERELKLDYFNHVFADFHRLDKPTRDDLRADLPPNLASLITQLEDDGEISADSESRLDWGEIATVEDKILARQDEETIRRRTWQVRARYARLVGAERYQLYLASGPPDEKDKGTSVDSLRADLRRLLAATHLNYSMAMVRENNRRRVMKKVGWWTFGLCVATLIAAGMFMKSGDTNLADDRALAGATFAVMLFGCLGAYISVQRRLQESSDGGDPVIGILGLHEFNSIQPFPLVAGGLFAVVLYFLMAGEFLTGDLFPRFPEGVGVPGTIKDWGKLCIWSLLAGFAERLVPDTLDRLVNQARPATPPVVVPPGNSNQAAAPPGEPKEGADKPAEQGANKPAEQGADKPAEQGNAPGGDQPPDGEAAGEGSAKPGDR